MSFPPSIIHRVSSLSLSHVRIELNRAESSRSVTAKLISIPPFLQLYVSRIIHNRIRAFSYTSIEPSIIFPPLKRESRKREEDERVRERKRHNSGREIRGEEVAKE